MIIGIDGSRAFVEEKTGTERYAWEMLRALSKIDNRNKYVIFVKQISKIKNQIAKIHSKNKILTSNSKLETGNFTYVNIPWPRLWTQGGLALETWQRKLDVLWVPAHTLPVLGNPRLPMVVTIHGIEYEYLPGAYKWGSNLQLTWSTRWAVKRAQRIVAVSGKTKEDLVERLGVKEEKVEVIWEGVDVNKFLISNSKFLIKDQISNDKLTKKELSSLRAQRSGAKQSGRGMTALEKYGVKKPYILFVGTVQPRKNLVRLIEAFSLIDQMSKRANNQKNNKTKQQNDEITTLAIAGKQGWDYGEILAAPKKFGVEGRVKFLGYVPDEDLPELYRNADLYVEPSLQEGFGLPVLEAMAAGVPVVAARAGALPEVVGGAGILVDPTSVESMAEGIMKVLENKELRDQLISRGRERVKEFSWEAAAGKLVEVFEEVKKGWHC